jgi:acyl-CoA dehydrogenase
MDFELNKEQKALQKAAWEFAKKEFTPELALECEEKHEFPHALHRKACELGFLGMHYPEEYGGQGYGFLESVLVMEAFCR